MGMDKHLGVSFFAVGMYFENMFCLEGSLKKTLTMHFEVHAPHSWTEYLAIRLIRKAWHAMGKPLMLSIRITHQRMGG